MVWKEAKHQFVKDDFFLKWFYGNRKPKSNYSTLIVFSQLLTRKVMMSPEEDKIFQLPAHGIQ